LEAITHPRIAARTAELIRQAPADAVVVHDVPLLVEKGMADRYDLVVIVGASQATRLTRLADRGMSADDARARIAAQATDNQRREVADVWIENDGPLTRLHAQVEALWDECERRVGREATPG
jgi:dephospho-CoA kinase